MGDNKFKYCDEKCFHLSSDCNDHELIHSGLKLYQCKYCDRCFNYPSNCKRHEVLHNGVKPYQCKYCDKCFNRSSNCKRHEVLHNGVKPYQCKYCDKCFNRSSNCKRHEVLHNGVKPYQCKYCAKCFNRSSNCKRHEVLHNRVTPYQCKYCAKCFNRSSSCKRHELLHTQIKPMLGEKKIRRSNKAVTSMEQGACNNEQRPYECKYYNKCFCSSLVCKRHELVHVSTAVKSCLCKFCDTCMCFNQSASCKWHDHAQNGVKPYQCKYCIEFFNCSSNYFERQELVHTGLKNDQCKYNGEKCFTCNWSPSCKIRDQIDNEVKSSKEVVNNLICWICQEELSTQELLLDHYDKHMILK